MGYGGSDAPTSADQYTWKHHADAFAGIAKHIGVNKIILGGHDWCVLFKDRDRNADRLRGGMVVYRFAQWYPDLVTHVFSVATPFFAPNSTYVSPADLVAGPLPNFGYQLQLGSDDGVIEKAIHDKPTLRRFLKAAYGGQVPSQANMFSPETGFNIAAITKEDVGMTPLLSAEVRRPCTDVILLTVAVQELDYYVDHFSIHGMHGPCNW